MKLDALYAHLRQRAAATRTHQHSVLRGGARLAVGVEDDWTCVTFSRPEKPLGDTELITFHRVCGVPASATRLPREGQRTSTVGAATWYAVSYRWQEEEETP